MSTDLAALSEVMRNIPMSPFVPVKPAPKQLSFLANMGKEALFGGTARSSKSYAALMAALQFVCVPGYSAIIFRRERVSLELPDGLIDIAASWLNAKAHWSGDRYRWTFPSGATLSFGFISDRKDLLKYHCVAPDTPILMADGSFKRIDSIAIGEHVQTLEGPRPITHSASMGVKDAVRITTNQGSVIAAEDHALMDASGDWVCPRVLWPTRSHADGTSSSTLPRSTPSVQRRRLARQLDRQRMLAGFRVRQRSVQSQASDAWETGGTTGCTPSPLNTRGSERPPSASAPVARRQPARRRSVVRQASSSTGVAIGCTPFSLNIPGLLLPEPASVLPAGLRQLVLPRSATASHLHDGGDGWSVTRTTPGCPGGCLACHGQYGARLLCVTEVDLSRIPSQVGVAVPADPCPQQDGRSRTPTRNRPHRATYVHPYTTRVRSTSQSVSAALRSATVEVVRVGAQAMWDVTVDSSNHYITAAGLVHSNSSAYQFILFEEIAEWPTDAEYSYMFSRLTPKKDYDGTLPRCKCHGWSVADVPLRMRSTANPGGPGQAWVRTNFILPHRAGQRGIFHPASYKDNPYLDHEEYEKTVAKMRAIDRARILGGDWDISAPGDQFSRDWFKLMPERWVQDFLNDPTTKMERRWDMAGTKVKRTNRDPDFTVGALVATRKGQVDDEWLIVDIDRFRDTAGSVIARIKTLSKVDDRRYRRHVPIRVEREPGVQARMALAIVKRDHFSGFNFRGVPSKVSKADRIDVLAVSAETGEMFMPEGAAFVEAFLDEAEAFGNIGVKDDQLDAVSGAMIDLSRGGGVKIAARRGEREATATGIEDRSAAGYDVFAKAGTRTRSPSGMTGGYSDYLG